MITSTIEKSIAAKQEGDGNYDNKRFSKTPAPSSSRQWSTFRNPRIVRVSRSFGGKDRHSKVCTVRGLRDRRIRLSVPTAIQLYDLQDRLGLSQPSKVIDWLINATKNDIDKLPPLQLPPGFGHQFHQQMLLPHEFNSSQSSLAPFFDPTFNKDIGFHSFGIKATNTSATLDGDDQNITIAKAKYWETEAEPSLRATASISEKGKWIKTNDQHNQDGVVSAQNLFPLASTHSSFPSLLNNPMPFNSYYHWDASNLSLSQFGTTSPHHGFAPQTETSSLNPNAGTVPLPGSQFFLCPPPTISSLFPQYPPYVATPMETNEPRETNHFQWLTSTSGNNPTKSTFSLNANQGLALGHHHSQRNNSGSQPHKDHDADS